MEIRGTVERLEMEKSELEWQAEVLRCQLARQRKRVTTGSGGGRQATSRPSEASAEMSDVDQRKVLTGRGKKTQLADGSLGNWAASPSEEHNTLAARPSMLNIPDCDEAPPRHRDPAADLEGDGEGATEDEKSQYSEEERFPPRSEYMKELRDVLNKDQTFALDHLTRAPSRQLSRMSHLAASVPRTFLYIASPRSATRTAWEVAGAIFVCWDLFVIPLAVFCYPMNGLAIAMEWTTLLYWTLNVPQTLTVGYEAGLKTVMSPSSILIRYLKGWCIIDMVVLVPDWIIAVLGLGSNTDQHTSCDSAVEGTGAVKLLRNLRLMRLVRLTRITRLQKMWQLVKERILADIH
ncbi:unnamed protein product [Prorocentrum cordatum]|uniref:Ion transport domain-containing protein n=1 Tax=Prorocentrum cordatum TaxID=2364126 RepID=A0ABN9SS43_9DINO|nr:unnamed protein product [Polarella glacialis]